jgi:hypothetical protein
MRLAVDAAPDRRPPLSAVQEPVLASTTAAEARAATKAEGAAAMRDGTGGHAYYRYVVVVGLTSSGAAFVEQHTAAEADAVTQAAELAINAIPGVFYVDAVRVDALAPLTPEPASSAPEVQP